jgi:hypothetical protein
VGVLSGALELSSAWATTCARTTTGVYCWGLNFADETGHPSGASGDVSCYNGSSCSPLPVQVPGL